MTADSPHLPAPRPRNGQHRVPIFFLALVFGVGAHLAALALFHFDVTAPTLPAVPQSFVHFAKVADAGEDKVLRQAEAIWDPQLIYAPNPLSYSSRPIAVAKPPPRQVFNADAGRALPLPPTDNFHPLDANGKPIAPSESLQSARWDFLTNIGQVANATPKPPARGAQLRITPQSAGASVTATEVTWPVSMAPKAGNVRWQPASFLLVFNEAGLAGRPLLEQSSGVTDVDNALIVELQQWYARHRLPPGYYSIEVGQ